jgi:uncharacterized protein with von Willebrand factor type A (vWA) domain
MPSTLFEQQRIVMAQIRSNYFTILHENEDLRKLVTKLQKENDELKRNLEKTSQEISSNDAR